MPLPQFTNAAKSVRLVQTDALVGLRQLPAACVDLVCTDPPWNTGATQVLGEYQYEDSFENFEAFLRPILQECWRVLRPTGSCVVHMGVQEAHTTRALLDEVFGRAHMTEELIAHHEVGRLPSSGWGCKHSHIYIYRKGDARTFNVDKVPEVSRNASRADLGPTKRANSVLPATLVTTDSQRVGYPSQKQLALYRTLVEVHSHVGDVVLDPFAGSGTTGDAAYRSGRLAVLMDNNPAAVRVICARLALQQIT